MGQALLYCREVMERAWQMSEQGLSAGHDLLRHSLDRLMDMRCSSVQHSTTLPWTTAAASGICRSTSGCRGAAPAQPPTVGGYLPADRRCAGPLGGAQGGHRVV